MKQKIDLSYGWYRIPRLQLLKSGWERSGGKKVKICVPILLHIFGQLNFYLKNDIISETNGPTSLARIFLRKLDESVRCVRIFIQLSKLFFRNFILVSVNFK